MEAPKPVFGLPGLLDEPDEEVSAPGFPGLGIGIAT
jgi:hypothetical protein